MPRNENNKDSDKDSGSSNSMLAIVEASWKPIAAIAVPIAVAMAPPISSWYTNDRGVDSIFAKEAISILQKPLEDEEDSYVRDWALDVIERLSQTEFSVEAREFLRQVPGPISSSRIVSTPISPAELEAAISEAEEMNLSNILAVASSEIGQAEIEGPDENPRIREYFQSVGMEVGEEVPWNAAFMNWVVQKAGYEGTNSAAARSFHSWGLDSAKVAGKEPVGCIAVFWRQNPPPASGPGTVGVYLGDDAVGNMRVLSGNVYNSVNATSASRDKLMSCRLPPNWSPRSSQ